MLVFKACQPLLVYLILKSGFFSNNIYFKKLFPDCLNHITVKIKKNTEKCPGELKRLAITEILVQTINYYCITNLQRVKNNKELHVKHLNKCIYSFELNTGVFHYIFQRLFIQLV